MSSAHVLHIDPDIHLNIPTFGDATNHPHGDVSRDITDGMPRDTLYADADMPGVVGKGVISPYMLAYPLSPLALQAAQGECS